MPFAHTGRTQRPDPSTPYMQPITARMLRHPDPGPSLAGLPDSTPARTLVDVLRETAARHADNPAIDADVVLNYAELADRANQLARRLTAAGVGRGGRVGVRVSSGTADLYIAILGVLEAGAAYVPVDADDPPARATELLHRAGACAVVEDGLAIRSLVSAPGTAVLGAAAEIVPGGTGAPRPGPEDDAWIIFTSGSTGVPKAVAVSHRSAAAFVDAEAELFEIEPEDRVLAGLSVAFDASCEEMWLAWRHGATLVPAPRAVVRAGAELGPWLVRRQITVVSTVPTLAAMWDEADLEDVRLLILGGEACPEGLGWSLAEQREVWNTYGPTEATVVTTAARIHPGDAIMIGWPLAGWEVAVLDEAGEVVPVGEPGELVIGGVGLGRYLDPELDRERFRPVRSLGWERAYPTGDVVRSNVEGIEFVGRRDDQVKVGGRRIELGEIDAQLSAVPGVRAAAAALRESAAGNKLLVGYVVGDVDPAEVRAALAHSLPQGMVPLIISLEELPRGISGKVDRKALPWPPPARSMQFDELAAGTTAAWLAERWAEQLGPLPIGIDSDFFELGGTSLAAAKLVSSLRARFPSVAVADVYGHRRLGELSERLDSLGEARATRAVEPARERRRRWGALQLVGVLIVQILISPQWLIAVLAVNRLEGGIGPRLGWGWLIAGWLVFASVPGRAVMLAGARKVLLRNVAPGRYPRHSWLMFRIWLLERLAGSWRIQGLEGTPWAARYARLGGHHVGRGARLFTLPPVASLITIGEAATIEGEVDLEGWWIDGDELVLGQVGVGAGARVGGLSVLMPGAEIGAGAEVEPGSVVDGRVPAGERWAGSPARRVGVAGEAWPEGAVAMPDRARFWKAMYGLGLSVKNLLPLLAIVPEVVALLAIAPSGFGPSRLADESIVLAPLLVLSFLVCYGLLTALVIRAVSGLIRPGWHAEQGATRWALWLTEVLLGATNSVLFPLYASVFTRFWLRLLGVRVGKRAEVSVVSGLNRLTSFGDMSFAADAAVFASARSRQGWLHVGPVEVGDGSFVGNGAILRDATVVGDGSLVGVLTAAPREVPDGTSWFGSPALELPRVPDAVDPARTIDPPRRLVLARGATELVRILLGNSISVILASLMFAVLEAIGLRDGLGAMAVATPLALLAGGICAVAVTIALKWLLIGRYRVGEHPLWSFFVWRDEIMNTTQERLAGTWLMGAAQATPMMSLYLRLMGAKVGRDVWCDTNTITEFDMVELGDGCVVNRHGIVQAHLFHDRVLRIGPVSLGPHSTLGPISAILPEAALGEGCSVGARSVVMRGERLPDATRWHGAPVVAA
jgi:non-ribosomal peptide synthetase-like protein